MHSEQLPSGSDFLWAEAKQEESGKGKEFRQKTRRKEEKQAYSSEPTA